MGNEKETQRLFREVAPTEVLNSMATMWANWINKQFIRILDIWARCWKFFFFSPPVLCTAYFVLRRKKRPGLAEKHPFSFNADRNLRTDQWPLWLLVLEINETYFTVCKSFILMEKNKVCIKQENKNTKTLLMGEDCWLIRLFAQ